MDSNRPATAPHTAEPWHVTDERGKVAVEPAILVHAAASLVAILRPTPEGAELQDARRIVACVNACAGIADPAAALTNARKMIEAFWVDCALAEYTDTDEVWVVFEEVYKALGGTGDLEAMGHAARDEQDELDDEEAETDTATAPEGKSDERLLRQYKEEN